MIDFKVANGDIVLDSNNNIETVNSIAQSVYITFACWMGDWFYDLTFGVDYPRLKDNASSKEEVDTKIRSILLGIPGVVSILQFTSTLDIQTRVYVFSITYSTIQTPVNILTSQALANILKKAA